jgi:hypothetical protein
MIKKILQWALPSTIILLMIFSASSLVLDSPFKESEYTFTVKDKWQSLSSNRYRTSEYNFLELCLVDTPSHCIPLNVRVTDWRKTTMGDTVTFLLEKKMVYRQTGVKEILSVISFACLFTLLLFTVIYGVVSLITKLYGEGK